MSQAYFGPKHPPGKAETDPKGRAACEGVPRGRAKLNWRWKGCWILGQPWRSSRPRPQVRILASVRWCPACLPQRHPPGPQSLSCRETLSCLSPGPPRSWEEAVALLTRQEGEQSKASSSPPAHLPSSRLCPPPPQHSVAPIPPGEEWPLAWVVRGTCKGLAGLQSQSQRGQTQDLLPPTSGAPAALLAVLGVGPLGTWDSKEEPQRVPRAPIRMSTQEPPGGRPEAGTKGEVTCQLVQVCWLGPQGSHRLGGRGR